jgi:uncharacterized protein YcbK (DUF882 family)
MQFTRKVWASAWGLAGIAACGAGTTYAGTASARGPSIRARHGGHATIDAGTAPAPSVNTGVAAAYLAGKQALVGLHAPCSDAIPVDPTGRPMLSLRTVNRGESLAIPSSTDDGAFCSADLDRVAHLLRASSGDEHPIDPRTLSLVYRIQRRFVVPEIRVVSGYRVPRPGSHSNHGKGRAIDLVVPGTADEEVARFARELGFVGVGVYPTSQFLHVDIRPRSYFWVDLSGPHMRNREQSILADLAGRSDAAALGRGVSPVEPFLVGGDVDSVGAAREAAHAPVVTAASPAPNGGPAATDEEEEDEN